jgi:hypothetical protein
LKCKICIRKASQKGYCKFHAKAYENIIQNYDPWKKALEISWKEYLSEIAKNPLTGQWTKETVERLISSGEKKECRVKSSGESHQHHSQ